MLLFFMLSNKKQPDPEAIEKHFAVLALYLGARLTDTSDILSTSIAIGVGTTG